MFDMTPSPSVGMNLFNISLIKILFKIEFVQYIKKYFALQPENGKKLTLLRGENEYLPPFANGDFQEPA